MSYNNFSTSPSSSTTTLLEPAQQYAYKKSSIGGRGNYKLHPVSTTLPAPPLSSSPRTSGTFSVGIGGAGNLRSYEERAFISKEEEYARRVAQEMNAPDRFHFGVGGRGNRAYLSSQGSEKLNSRREVEGSGADKLKRGIVGLFGKEN